MAVDAEAPALGRALRAARALAEHKQEECAEALHTLGAPRVPQPTISAWENKGVPPEARAAVRAYVNQHLGAAVRDGLVHVAATGDPLQFEELARELSGEPLFTPRQGALIDAITERIARDSQFTSEDHAVINLVWNALRLPRR